MKLLHSKLSQTLVPVYLKTTLLFLFLISQVCSYAQIPGLSSHYGFYITRDSSEVAFWAPVLKKQKLNGHYFTKRDDGIDKLHITIIQKTKQSDTTLWHLYNCIDTLSVARFSTGKNKYGHYSRRYMGHVRFIDSVGNHQDTSAMLSYYLGKKSREVDSIYKIFYVVAPADTTPSVLQAYCVVNFKAYESDNLDSITFVRDSTGLKPDSFMVYVTTTPEHVGQPEKMFVGISTQMRLHPGKSHYQLITQTVLNYVSTDTTRKKIPSAIAIKSYDDPHHTLIAPSIRVDSSDCRKKTKCWEFCKRRKCKKNTNKIEKGAVQFIGKRCRARSLTWCIVKKQHEIITSSIANKC